ncbi:MAG TPA: hypothetical protein VHM20_06720 [Gammaproteobacteria bacterium]|nr:hypothetical protein [Gammaproteobacteria bacterium]
MSELFGKKSSKQKVIEASYEQESKRQAENFTENWIRLSFKNAINGDYPPIIDHNITTYSVQLDAYYKRDKLSWVHELIKAHPNYLPRLEKKNIDFGYHLMYKGKNTLLSAFVMAQQDEEVMLIINWTQKLNLHPDDMPNYYEHALMLAKGYLNSPDHPSAGKIHDALTEPAGKIELFKQKRKTLLNGLSLFPFDLTDVVVQYLEGEQKSTNQMKKL